MKQYTLFFICITLILGSCQSSIPKNAKSTFINGNVLEDGIESILFYTDTLFKVIPVQNKKFQFEIPSRSENYFLGIAAKFNRGYFYVATGDTIELVINPDTFNQSLYGNLKDPVNQYLALKEKKLEMFPIMNIDSIQITQKLDSLAFVLNQDFEQFKKTYPLPSSLKKTEQININAELQKLDLTNKNITGRKSTLLDEIEFNTDFINSPKYLDLLDNLRWSLANPRIEKEGKLADKMALDELINYQMKEIVEIKEKPIKSFLLFKALRSQIAMKGIEGIDKNRNLFDNSNSIKNYEELINEMINTRTAIKRGTMANDFSYENVQGELVKLSDFKGKFVFIDVWATWCAPCIKEMPYLKEIEKSFANEEIEFIAVSIDKDQEQWKNFIAKNDLKGIQLIADKADESSIMRDYSIMGLPNYLLIDDKGALITVSALKPSSGKLKSFLEKELKMNTTKDKS